MKRIVEKDGTINVVQCIERLKQQKDGKYSIEIKKYGSKTDAQSGYYWGVVLETIARETGYNGVQWFYLGDMPLILDGKDYLHAIMKGLTKKRTSKDMTKFEYSELIETAIEVADFLGIKVPEAIK